MKWVNPSSQVRYRTSSRSMSMLMVIIGLIYSKLDACQVVVHPNHYCTGLICKVIVLKGCEVLGVFCFLGFFERQLLYFKYRGQQIWQKSKVIRLRGGTPDHTASQKTNKKPDTRTKQTKKTHHHNKVENKNKLPCIKD